VAVRDSLNELMKGKTVIAIAHRLSTIAAMDRLVVLDRGRIVQKAPARELYLHPNSLFLANFMGESSIFAGELHGNSVTTNGYRFELPDAG